MKQYIVVLFDGTATADGRIHPSTAVIKRPHVTLLLQIYRKTAPIFKQANAVCRSLAGVDITCRLECVKYRQPDPFAVSNHVLVTNSDVENLPYKNNHERFE